MRIAIDIDSTLHHHWDLLSRISQRRFGIGLPYEEQLTWGVTRLRPEQLQVCITESRSDEHILAAKPYPGAVETLRRWHEAGHRLHICSSRPPGRTEVTGRWLQGLGVPYDSLECAEDKLRGCLQREVELLIDDDPIDGGRAIERGIALATLMHPWNRDLRDEEDVLAAPDWATLGRLLDPILAGPPATALNRH